MKSISKCSKTHICMINYVLPSEILKKIFELLDIKSLCSARQTCKCWNEIIVVFELVEEAASKTKPNKFTIVSFVCLNVCV